MSKKKKAKNSDYRYLQRHYDEQREERERAQRKAEKNKRRFIMIIAVVLIIMGVCNGGMDDVLAKGASICTECIGLG